MAAASKSHPFWWFALSLGMLTPFIYLSWRREYAQMVPTDVRGERRKCLPVVPGRGRRRSGGGGRSRDVTGDIAREKPGAYSAPGVPERTAGNRTGVYGKAAGKRGRARTNTDRKGVRGCPCRSVFVRGPMAPA